MGHPEYVADLAPFGAVLPPCRIDTIAQRQESTRLFAIIEVMETMGVQKLMGRFLFRDLAPLLSDFRRPGSVSGSQLIAASESFGDRERSPRSPNITVITFVVRAFSFHP
jgi:hypothetical protein